MLFLSPDRPEQEVKVQSDVYNHDKNEWATRNASRKFLWDEILVQADNVVHQEESKHLVHHIQKLDQRVL